MIQPWRATAFNQVPDAANQIHGDELALQYGFAGALVPGVTISAYLLHPAVEAWGLRWLERGAAHVRISSPLYDGEAFEVYIVESTESSFRSELKRAEGVICAAAEVSLPETTEPPPVRRNDPLLESDQQAPNATPQRWAELQRSGCVSIRDQWPGESPMRTYTREPQQMPELLWIDGGGYANMSYILGCSNWILERNAYMNPWFHLETHSQNFGPIPPGTPVVTEMLVADCFEKKGHRFVDADVALFDDRDDAPLARIKLRAIYQLRGAD